MSRKVGSFGSGAASGFVPLFRHDKWVRSCETILNDIHSPRQVGSFRMKVANGFVRDWDQKMGSFRNGTSVDCRPGEALTMKLEAFDPVACPYLNIFRGWGVQLPEFLRPIIELGPETIPQPFANFKRLFLQWV
jgi:hypothetical protein